MYWERESNNKEVKRKVEKWDKVGEEKEGENWIKEIGKREGTLGDI